MTFVHIQPKYITNISQVEGLDPIQVKQLAPVTDKFVFRTNDYYQSLINWDDPNDPLRRIVMPDVAELEEFGKWDASDEASYTVVKGLEHKYADTALLLINNVCGAYCRFCFRKRLFTTDNDEVTNDITDALVYIHHHPEINNVLLSGGDPMIMSTGRLEKIVREIRAIDHVNIIRIGTKMVAFNPYRIINDPTLLEMVSRYSTSQKRIYVMAHFNHPRELTEVAMLGIHLLQKAGATVVNQSPIIRGVNDTDEVMAQLFTRLSFAGVPPYYIFICRPTLGNRPYVVPIEESLSIFEKARLDVSGLARHARLCMSHKTGKIEVVGKTEDYVIFRYHRAAKPQDREKVMLYRSNPAACWLDDYEEWMLRPEAEIPAYLGAAIA